MNVYMVLGLLSWLGSAVLFYYLFIGVRKLYFISSKTSKFEKKPSKKSKFFLYAFTVLGFLFIFIIQSFVYNIIYKLGYFDNLYEIIEFDFLERYTIVTRIIAIAFLIAMLKKLLLPKTSFMKSLGGLMLVIGIILGIYALNMDTTVDSPLFGGNFRVNNLGLMNEKTNYLIFSGILSLVGVLLLAMPGKKEFENEVKYVAPVETQSFADELAKLLLLKEKGALTDEEFGWQKQKLLDSQK